MCFQAGCRGFEFRLPLQGLWTSRFRAAHLAEEPGDRPHRLIIGLDGRPTDRHGLAWDADERAHWPTR
jgi:hypothetical protein